jgi:8-oxo-dGTP diphosphatase
MSDRHWLIHFADAEMKPEYFTGPNAEEAARKRHEELLNNWNCRLFAEPETKGKLPIGVSILLVNRDGRVALGWRPENIAAGGFLSTPGGRIEENEHLEETAARELKEETGVHLLPSMFKILGFKEHFRFTGHYFMVYVAAYYDGPLERKEPDKCLGWEWWKLTDIPRDRCTEPLDILMLLAKGSTNERQA